MRPHNETSEYIKKLVNRSAWYGYSLDMADCFIRIDRDTSEFFGKGTVFGPVVIRIPLYRSSEKTVVDFVYLGEKENAVVKLQAGELSSRNVKRKRASLRCAQDFLQRESGCEFKAYVLGFSSDEGGRMPWLYEVLPVGMGSYEPKPFMKIGE